MDEFNRKCAEFMGYKLVANPFSSSGQSYNLGDGKGNIYHNPHDDMNQLVEVIDKFIKDPDRYYMRDFPTKFRIEQAGLRQALIDFVTECLEE